METTRLKNDLDSSMRLFCSKGCDSPTKKEKDGMEDEKGEPPGMDRIDRFGIYQMIVYAVISIPLLISAGSTLSYVFTAGETKYRCLVPECEDPADTVFSPPWIAYSAPRTEFGNQATCTRYAVRNHTGSCSRYSFANATRNCDAWFYDPAESTILNEWNITCHANRWKLTLVGTINNVGQFFGLIFAGFVSDRYGRRTILTLATFMSGLSGLIHSFSTSYWMFIVFEFLDATMSAGLYSSGFILGMEMVGVKKRVLGGTITSCMFAVGEILLGLLAMWLRSWRLLLRVVYVPALFAIFLPFLIPESVRWLLAHGKNDEVERIYRKMARMNGLQVSDEAIGMFKELNIVKPPTNDRPSEKRGPVVQVLNSSVILTRLLTCSFCWLTNTFVYYGLSLNSVAFAGDKYTNFILVALVEIPAYFLTWLLTDQIGRKPTLSGSFLLSGAFCLAIQFVPADTWSYAPLVLYMGGKWCITMAFAAVYVYTAEMFPTSLRHSLLGICSMTGRVGSILAPQTPLLAHVMPELPLILFGCMGLFAGLLSLIFPETLGTKLPDTVYEAENIGKVQVKQDPQDSPS